MEALFTWLGILFCISQSAMFSGLNLAFFSFTRLRLEIEAEAAPEKNYQKIKKILDIRSDSNFLLTTILWGNVGINVLLTLLTDSVLAGVSSFLFSTVAITFFGEIIPQAYFSRHAMKMASLLFPVIRFYQFLLFPVAKPSAILLDVWLGKETIQYFDEENIKIFIKKHIQGHENEIEYVEGTGAINFLSLDDISIANEGEPINPLSIVTVHTTDGIPVFPLVTADINDPFIRKIQESGEKWIVFQDVSEMPLRVLDSDGYIRAVLFSDIPVDIEEFTHAPIVFTDRSYKMDTVIRQLRSSYKRGEDRPIDKDIVLFWSESEKRVITGADLLGRLLKNI